MRLFNNIFRRKAMKDPVRTLRIDGVKAPEMTARPDDAELAAQALLEHKSEPKGHKKKAKAKQPKEGTPEFFEQMSGKISDAHAAEARNALRYLAYTEQELKENPTPEQLAEIEKGLYQYQDTAEREKGELLTRWQHCIAECILLQQTEPDNDKTED
jgi:hypothetical protein